MTWGTGGRSTHRGSRSRERETPELSRLPLRLLLLSWDGATHVLVVETPHLKHSVRAEETG